MEARATAASVGWNVCWLRLNTGGLKISRLVEAPCAPTENRDALQKNRRFASTGCSESKKRASRLDAVLIFAVAGSQKLPLTGAPSLLKWTHQKDGKVYVYVVGFPPQMELGVASIRWME